MASTKELELAKVSDYSQHGEQEIIGRFFQQSEVDYTPFFVDVGAYDGITGSNSRFLAELGWAGIAIEPNPDVFARLRTLYAEKPAVRCVQCAISDYVSDDVEMLISDGPKGIQSEDSWHYSQVSTLNQWFADDYIEKHKYRYRSVKVRVRPLAEILRANACPRDLGFLCIDCEGEDERILKALDISEFRPRLLSVECGDESRSMYDDHLSSRGYREYAHTSANAFFCTHP